MPDTIENLTDKQILFCKEYLIDLNAAAAAKRAGYSEGTAKEQGYQLMKKPEIIDTINRLKKERLDRVQVTADWVLQE